MASVHPFRAVRYSSATGDVSTKIAPPYDVLDAHDKRAMLERDPENIVAIDLPHVPAKELGPGAAYKQAAATMRSLMDTGVLAASETPAIYAYRQTFEFGGTRHQRCGVCAAIDTIPFGPREGGGVLAHEQTFGGPKEDRKALMRATQTQTSPIFGLHQDDDGAASALVRGIMDARAPDTSAHTGDDTGDGVTHEVWAIEDKATIDAYQQALAGEDIFIADGHHRYTTALNHLASLGDIPHDHPARRTMVVLVSMNDPGLVIGATHRVLGGMRGYSIDAFQDAAQGLLNIEAIDNDPRTIPAQMESLAHREKTNVFGIYDYATGLCFGAWPASDDPLSDRFDGKPRAWRDLDVAIVQHLIVEEICEPELNDGDPVAWAFPHTIDGVLAIGRGEDSGGSFAGGAKPQLAIIVRPTPLDAVREISRAGALMPQKSTYFCPKLATGLWLKPLAPTPARVP